jgi:hypothetical protein
LRVDLNAMLRPFAFMAALALGMVGPVEPPNMLPALDHELRRFSDASRAFIVETFTPAKAETEPVDPVAAANLDEDLDFRIAEQAKTGEAWRTFLDKHSHGKHASIAEAELDKLTKPFDKAPNGTPPPSAPKFAPLVEIANAPPQPQPPDLFAALERPPPPETKVVEVKTTVVKWRARTPTVTHWVYDRPRYRRRAQPLPFFLSWFGPPDPRAWGGH